MLPFVRAIAVMLLMAFGLLPAAAETQKAFVRDALASDAARLEAQVKAATPPTKPLAQVRRDAEAFFAKGKAQPNFMNDAYELFLQAATLDPKDWSVWNRIAQAGMNRPNQDQMQYTQRAELNTRTISAAYLAYLKAATKPDEATALATLGAVHAKQEEWRSSLNAYRDSLKLADDAGVRATYTDLREKYGFRMVEDTVDSDAASPRACFQFSEDLARGKIDFTPFVTVSGMTTPAVTAEGQQLCIDGLEHGRRYSIVIRQGLPSAVEENLLKPIDYDVYVRDRSPQVHFTGRNYVLPKTGQEGIPVVSINTAKLDVEVYRIGDRNLLPTLQQKDFLKSISGQAAKKLGDEAGVKIWTGTLDVKTELNKDVTTAFPVLEAVGKLEAGLYVMMAKPASVTQAATPSDEDEDYSDQATQWFVVSDLGLTAFSGEDGVHVLVRSLSSAEPAAGIELRLIAKNNEVLATKSTDASGYVRFDPGLARGAGGLAPGLVVASDTKGDYGFLDLSASAFDLTDRGVKGREAPTGLDAFVAAERGVYRSGENVYITAMLRDTKGLAVAGVPVTLVAERPDGVEYRRAAVEDQGLGGRSWSLPLISGLPTGTWRVKAYADPKRPPIGETSFLLEDYVPERLEVKLSSKQPLLHQGEPAEIDVAARYLYGAIGSDLEVTGEVGVSLADSTNIPGLEAYSIGLDDETFETTSQEIEEPGTTDEAGKVTMTVTLPDAAVKRSLEAKVTLRVGEPGGRAVERSVSVPIVPKGNVLGIKKLFDDGSLSNGSQAGFDIVYATNEGKRLASRAVRWELAKIDHRYQWFHQDGHWNYESVKSTRRVADGSIEVGTDQPARLSTPVEWGSYRLDLRTEDGDGPHSSISFSVGWGGSDKADTPDGLEVALDKTAYVSGEEMKLWISPRFAGKATIAIVSDKLHEIQVVDMPAGGATVPIKVSGDWGAGAYAVVLAHRPLDAKAKRMPGRALGLAWFAIDTAAHKLSVKIDTPADMRPRQTLTIPVKLAGLASGDSANIVVSAVDVGILNLTRYETPDPDSYLFGQRQLATEVRDLYGFLIDGMQGSQGAIRSGGDSSAKFQASPPTQEPLARYSGVVKVGADGAANVSFEIPAFNGTVRVAVLAWNKTQVGHGQADVIVRDPVVLAATLPRFLSIGDVSRFHMQLDNVEGPAADYTVDLDIHGPISIPAESLRSTVKLAKGAKGSLSIPVSAGGQGTAVVDVRVTGPGVDAAQTLIVKVQPATPAVYRRTVRPLAGNGASLTVSSDILADFLPGTGVVSVSVSPISALDVPGLLKALDRYPYGCSEQTVSRAMPLLYVNKLAQEEQLALDDKIDTRIKNAIEVELSRQDSNGSFGLWSVGGEDVWLSAYVTDFLTRARERGFVVPQVAFDLALGHLRNFVANTTEIDKEADKADALAYAIYVLARNGRPVMGDLRYLVDTKLSSFASPLARAQLGAALAMLGDRGRAQPAFASALDRLGEIRRDTTYRHDYGSPLRDGAGLIALMAEAGQPQAAYVKASQVIEERRAVVRYTSTQENAWMVLAAYSMLKEADKLSLTVDGASRGGAYYQTFRGLALDGQPVTIVNNSQVPAQMVVTASGHPIVPDPAVANGYKIERTYYKLDGTKTDVSKVKQNDRLVVVLEVTETVPEEAQLLLVDHLPAGLEIDNPELVDGGKTSGFDFLGEQIAASHTEFRDDRFVAAYDRTTSSPALFRTAYVVRAVAPGKYIHPPAVVEDMYRPERFGHTGFGTVEVLPAK